MSKDKVIGFLIFIGALVFGALYYIGMFTMDDAGVILTVKILMSLAVLFVVLIALWLGVEMMRTPSFEAPKEAKKAEAETEMK